MDIALAGLLILFVLGLVGLLLLTLLVVFLAKAIGGKKGAGGGLAVVAVIGLLVILIGGLFGSYQVRQADVVDYGTVGQQLPPGFTEAESLPPIMNYEDPSVSAGVENMGGISSQGVTVAGNPWTDAVEEFQDFEADVYPSLEAAAEALGRNLGRDLMEHVPAAQPANTTPVYVWMQSDGEEPATREGVLLVTRPVLEAVADGIRQKLVNPDVVSVERPTVGRSSSDASGGGVIVVRVHVNDVRYDNHNRWRKHTESGSGFLVAEVDTPDFDFSRNMRFDQKPWVADPSRFSSQYPGGQWLIAYSDMSNMQQVFAHNEAIRAAAESLLPKAEAYVSQLSPSQQHLYEQKKAANPDWLRKRIADELVSRNHQTDSFIQRYDRPNYTVWREALLIDAGPGVVENITAAMVNSLNARQTYQRNTWFSFIALAGLIYGTYLFLNMATKGYYAWTLRAAAVIGVIGVIFFIWTIRR